MTVLEPTAMKVAFGENIKTNYNQKNVMPSTCMLIAALLREDYSKLEKYNENKKKTIKNGDNFDRYLGRNVGYL